MPLSRLFSLVAGRARRLCPRIVFPEGTDARIVEGAARAHRDGLCRAMILGEPESIRATLSGLELSADGIELIDPVHDTRLGEFAENYRRQRSTESGRDLGEGAARRTVSRLLFFAPLLVRHGHAAGMVAGAEATTGSVLTAATAALGLAPGVRRVSSAYLMVGPETGFGTDGIFVFADPAVMPDPDAEDLAHLAVASADLLRRVVGVEPRVALLSFSTNGSAQHPLVERVREAGRCLAAMSPSFAFDAEVQFDAAVVPDIAARKFPGNRLGGRANVLIFPDLNAANICYKLAERLCGFRALGPFVLGLSAPLSDLSRGCSADDIVETATIVATMAGGAG